MIVSDFDSSQKAPDVQNVCFFRMRDVVSVFCLFFLLPGHFGSAQGAIEAFGGERS